MRESFRLGSFRGIPIGINWSLLVIAALVAVALGGGRYPEAFPGHEPPAYLLAGAVTAVLFFASVLAHELGHALVARQRGVEVGGITLWLFGGVARLETEASNPADELRIAVVGPLVSVACAAALGLLGGTLALVGAPDLAVGAAVWLALINAVLALFNLIPAAPLDGGRVLRALLWRRSGDRSRASVTASRAGRAFGLLLVAAGIAQFALVGGLDGVWLMLLGWFVITAARAEETQARLRGSLGDMTVAEIMTSEPVSAPDWLTVDRFLDDYALLHRCSAFPLRAFDGRVVGVVTLSAVKRLPQTLRADTRLRDIACPIERVPIISPTDEVATLLTRMGGSQGCSDGRVLVMDRGDLVGIVSPADVARLVTLAELRGPRQPSVA